jgi:hypothetical protein
LLAAAAVPEAAVSQQYARMHWACLITRHVCLDIMVPDEPAALQQLSRCASGQFHNPVYVACQQVLCDNIAINLSASIASFPAGHSRSR